MSSFLPFRRNRSVLAEDEAIIFYPTYGFRAQPESDVWTVAIQGCVYYPQVTWLRRRPVLAVIRRAMSVDRRRTEFFGERMRQFLVHFAAGKRISVRLGETSTTLAPSESVGLIRGPARVENSQVDYEVDPTTPCTPWMTFRAVLADDDVRDFSGRAQLLDPRGVSIISDVDDTIKHSNVPNRRELFHNTFVRDFVPIAGMPELYRECAALGAAFHYVSGSPWQLYEPLSEFWRSEGYPWGSFHLKRFRLRETARKLRTTSPQSVHKRAAIEPLLAAFPSRKFVLIGDSGEQDPEIYATLLQLYPDQIARVLIRGVRGIDVDLPRISRTFAGLPKDRWTLYQSPADIHDSLLSLVRELRVPHHSFAPAAGTNVVRERH